MKLLFSKPLIQEENTMAKTNHLQKIAVAASAFLALGSHHLNALSDSGTLTINGTVTATTCTVNFGGGGVGTSSGSTTLQLPSVTPTELGATGTAAAPAFLTNTTKFTVVTLTNTAGGTACTTGLTAGKTWDLTFTPSSAGTSAVGTVGFLKGGGTDALVGIKTAVVNSAADTPTFPATFTNAGGATTFAAAGTSGIAIQAGWVGVGKANHTVGNFTHALTVGIDYN
jgi:major type 1 subunit fimbrin (pilin)